MPSSAWKKKAVLRRNGADPHPCRIFHLLSLRRGRERGRGAARARPGLGDVGRGRGGGPRALAGQPDQGSGIDRVRGLVRAAVFFFNDAATAEIYTLSLHDALPI